jgi:hypothetical protein
MVTVNEEGSDERLLKPNSAQCEDAQVDPRKNEGGQRSTWERCARRRSGSGRRYVVRDVVQQREGKGKGTRARETRMEPGV